MEVVRALIEAGADASAQDKDGRNPLHEAARSSSSQAMEVVRALIEAGADATAQDKDGRNPLHERRGPVLTSHGGRTSAYRRGRRCDGPGQGWAQSIA
jgi:hypothetical protein